MAEETRQDKEKRYAREYAAYVAACTEQGIEAIGYMNWAYNKKMEEERGS